MGDNSAIEWTTWVALDGRPARDRCDPDMIQGSGTKWHLVTRLGKKAAGASLDGREWREFPTAPASPTVLAPDAATRGAMPT